MKVRSKILLGYGIAVFQLSLVIVWAVVNLLDLGRASNAILFENYRSILAADSMLAALERQDSAHLLIVAGDPAGPHQREDNDAAFLTWLARARDNITLPGERELLERISREYRQFRALPAQTSGSPGIADGMAHYRTAVYPRFASIRGLCEELRALNEAAMYQVSGRADRLSRFAVWSTTVLAAAILLMVLVFSLLFSERVTRPLRSLMQAAQRVGAGDYDTTVPSTGHDETAQLSAEFNRMARQLAEFHRLNIGRIIAAKQKNESIIASIEDGLIVFDAELRVTEINAAARRILALEQRETSTLTCATIFPEKDLCERLQAAALAPLVMKKEDDRTMALTVNGAERHYSIGITAIPDSGGGFTGIVLLLRDVTRLKAVERLKSEFVMAASHELRTPLTGLTMSIELLRERIAAGLAERDRELLEAARGEVRRLQALVVDLLDLSRIEAGRIELDFGMVTIPVLFARIAEIFGGQLQAKEVSLMVETPSTLPPVRADAGKVVWVLSNLVSNALRYAPRGGHIRLSAERFGAQAHLSVADDGPGIPAEYQSRIFQKFVQVEGRETGGTGLGLAICKEIVRAHGGTIWVESRPGCGSTFTFTLPVNEGV